MFDREQIERELLQFLQVNCRHTGLTTTTDLLETELLDSLLLMDLIIRIEERFQIRFDGGQVSPANFRNIEAIAGIVLQMAGPPRRKAA